MYSACEVSHLATSNTFLNRKHNTRSLCPTPHQFPPLPLPPNPQTININPTKTYQTLPFPFPLPPYNPTQPNPSLT